MGAENRRGGFASEAVGALGWILGFLALGLGVHLALGAWQRLTEPAVVVLFEPCDEEGTRIPLWSGPAPRAERAL